MKNYYKICILLLFALSIGGCDEQILNMESPSEPNSSTFYSTEQELQLALTGAYRVLDTTGLWPWLSDGI